MFIFAGVPALITWGVAGWHCTRVLQKQRKISSKKEVIRACLLIQYENHTINKEGYLQVRRREGLGIVESKWEGTWSGVPAEVYLGFFVQFDGHVIRYWILLHYYLHDMTFDREVHTIGKTSVFPLKVNKFPSNFYPFTHVLGCHPSRTQPVNLHKAIVTPQDLKSTNLQKRLCSVFNVFGIEEI